jgi:hypothetical protein
MTFKETNMWNPRGEILTGLALAASASAIVALGGDHVLAANAGGDPASTAAQTCLKAEVNPVTGHVLCINPLGAPVEAPPPAEPCQPHAYAAEAWSYGPKCSS